ncbi:MAG TPA: cytochrome c biogenesis protein CcsA [Planctomycetaceae bacterium]|nr:cytochrome c biogenesis protein CcsA [Planctomycetaceae bacterium]
MATAELMTANQPVFEDDSPAGVGPLFNALLAPLASLKLTVALFAMAIFIVLAGTLAQVEKDIWQVIDEYFRNRWFAWIDFQLFLPPSFWGALFGTKVPQIPGGFYFPSGWLIGAVMAMNLLAAHLVRFKVQARGWRLVSGLLLSMVGIALTTLVVTSANNTEGLQGEPWVSYDALWWLLLAGLAGLCAASLYGWCRAAFGGLTWWLLTAAVVLQAGVLLYGVSRGMDGRLSDSGMRILWQLTQGGLAGLVLLAGCIMVFKQRGGIVLLHGGIGLMMFGELLVGRTAIEAQIQMQEGETVNFVQDIRTVELAVVDRSDPEHDQVTVIPRRLLIESLDSRQPISDDRLPFRIQVDQFFQNSAIRRVKPEDKNKNPATDGVGKDWIAENVRPGSGTDTDSKVDLSACYVTILPKDGDTPLAKPLLGLIFSSQNIEEKIKVGDASYDIALRFQRTYKPYKFQLVDVRKDDYIGTSTPKNYSSDVRLVDDTRHVDRTLKIWMNNPLRFAGETFYQSGYHVDPQTQIEGTTLQVVTNGGWMIPYVSCMLVAAGLLAHFSIVLLRFLRRTETSQAAIDRPLSAQQPATKKLPPVIARQAAPLTGPLGWIFPLTAGVAALVLVAVTAMPPRTGDREKEFDLYAFGKLPLIAEGRAKPLDTLARTSLMAVSGKQTFQDANKKSQPAIKWLLDVMARPEQAFTHRAFKIENLEVQKLVGLEKRERFRYSPEEFLPKLSELTKQAALAHEQDAANVSVFQKKVLELEKKIGILDLLLQSFNPPNIKPETAKDDLMEAIGRQRALEKRHPPLVVPPADNTGAWDTFAGAWTKNLVKTTFLSQPADEPTEAMTRILVAYAGNEPEKFNEEVAKYQAWLDGHTPPDLNTQRTEFETFFNHFQPFFITQMLYVFAFALGAMAWLGWAKPFNRAALSVALVAFALHTFALIARMYISGRPPVTNLYSSAVFMGWGCALLGLAFNLFYRDGVGTVVAAIAGYLTLGVAEVLSADGDTFIVLQAVLDTQFWLATHVTCMVSGYATTFLAGLLGMMYVLRGVCTPSFTAADGRDMYRRIYGTLCFSIFFSFVGTVLGGLWADDSWGRFWGWDPKENAALMIVLWNALVLHARWGGMVKERGLALLAVLGNIAVSWSWFGVNELGIGLHAYGFREGMVQLLAGIFAVSLATVAVGLIPKKHWWSAA